MAPKIGIELYEIDCLLDKENMILRVEVTKRVVVDITEDSLDQKGNKKLNTSYTIKQDSMIKVERDITILKVLKILNNLQIQDMP